MRAFDFILLIVGAVNITFYAAWGGPINLGVGVLCMTEAVVFALSDAA